MPPPSLVLMVLRMTLEDTEEAWQQHADFTAGDGDDDTVALGNRQYHNEKTAQAATISLPAFLVAFEHLARAKYLPRQRHGKVDRLLLNDVFGNAMAAVSAAATTQYMLTKNVLAIRYITAKCMPISQKNSFLRRGGEPSTMR